MKRLHFSYEMQIKYTTQVERCHFTIKCLPKSTCRQSVQDFEISLEPPVQYNVGIDGLRNLQIYGMNDTPHTVFDFKIEGEVKTGFSNYEEDVDEDLSMVFKHPFGLNKAGGAIKGFYRGLKLRKEANDYEKSVEIMHALYKKFRYQSFSTTIETTAEEAFAQGCGVCQDYAHIFISLLHLAHIPARYVTGLIIGEGESHAWVEVLYNNKWYGLDPTNNHSVNDHYIKIGVGRDARDCAINRGIMHGGGGHVQIVKVAVREID